MLRTADNSGISTIDGLDLPDSYLASACLLILFPNRSARSCRDNPRILRADFNRSGKYLSSIVWGYRFSVSGDKLIDKYTNYNTFVNLFFLIHTQDEYHFWGDVFKQKGDSL